MRLIAPANATPWAVHGQDILQDLTCCLRFGKTVDTLTSSH
eukprot:COSAG02_NODE_61872_length_267_cov_0.910714_1_plen_40_part_10